VKLYTSVSAVISMSCVSGHKRLFTSYIISCYPWYHLCGRRLHYPIPIIEILRKRGRKIHLQLEYVMMVLMDYPSSSHRKLNCHTGHLRPDRMRPFSWPYCTSLFTMRLIKQTDKMRDCGSSSCL
jgi:hypothetical protein